MILVKLIQWVLIGILLLAGFSSQGQKRWVGASSNWDDALNWQPAAVPDSNDQVLLDNSFQPSAYTVSLPNHAVVVNSILIAPSAGRQIELQLPVTNLGSPGFTVRSTGDAIIIKSGGVFRNTSGLGSGQSFQINGLLRIENGGIYIHQTRSTHAADIVARLSTAAGTENGQFEFDVPGGSYPVSLSNRVYGKLVFSSGASGGTQTYNASGTNPLLVRGDLAINNGVVLNLDFTKDCTVMGNYLQQGGVFNVASQPAFNVVNIQGDINQQAAGTITETSTGQPVIQLNGNKRQLVSLAGTLQNQLTVRINNPNGVSLLQNLTIPYLLQLQQGNLFTTSAARLIIPDDGRIAGASAQSFVDGPVQKTGDEAFDFPVGRLADYAPVTISAGVSNTDEFIVAYNYGNPQAVYGTAVENNSIHHLSALEYWTVEKKAGSSSRKITLSVGTYSHATAIDKLVVSRWDSTQQIWKNEGNSGWTGIATGTLTSNPLTGYGAFTLASTIENQNPLPIETTRNKGPGNANTRKSFFEIKQITHAGSDVMIRVFSQQKQSLQITITSIDGRTMHNAKHEVMEGYNYVRCRLPVHAGGSYIVRIVDSLELGSKVLNKDSKDLTDTGIVFW